MGRKGGAEAAAEEDGGAGSRGRRSEAATARSPSTCDGEGERETDGRRL